MRISAREACVKPHLRTRSDINNFIIYIITNASFFEGLIEHEEIRFYI